MRLLPLNRPVNPTRGLRCAGLAAGLLLSAAVQAQLQGQPPSPAGTENPAAVQLRSSPRLQESITPAERREAPLHLEGGHITVRPDLDLRVQGGARLRRPGLSVQAGRIDYDQVQDRLQAEDGVRIQREFTRMEGPRLDLRLDSFRGRFEQPRFDVLQSGGYGEADRVDFVDASRATVHQARYTTCGRNPGPGWLPEWLLKATRMDIDEEESSIHARGVQLRFMDVPVLALPALSFGLTGERRSGWLSPLVGVDTVNGIDLQAPYYWNIAPNRDATVTPRWMSKRGLSAETELRYLESDYSGQARLNLMPQDSLRDARRWGLSLQHSGSLDSGITPLGRLGLGLNISRVSDDQYWKDFPRSGSGANLALTQRLLPATASLHWARDGLSMMAQVQRWQTLQDPLSSSYITPPYDRVPQIQLRYNLWQAQGLDVSVLADTTRFEADYSRLPASPAVARNGERSLVQAQLGRSWIRPWGFLTPALKLHATRYQLDAPLDTGQRALQRVLPTLSLDAGLTFERETRWFARDVLQTLEPRAYYVRTPYRAQDMLPVYDSGATDFNLSTIFSDNPYVGQDRIVDNDSLTLGLTSRFFDSRSGAQMARMGLAQRIRFSNQQVVLPGQTAAQSGLSDLLLGAGIRWDDQWAFDGTVQMDSQTDRVVRSTLQARYSPGPYRVINAAYRVNRGVSEQVDLGWQWPLRELFGRGAASGGQACSASAASAGQGLGAGRWYSVGRLNLSVPDSRLVDTLLGLEYDGGCWLGRVVFERLSSTLGSASTRLYFQLEFVGLARIGSNPLRTLRDNIPRYQYLRDDVAPTSRFQHYE